MFQGDIIGKIAANPKISSYLADPEFVRRINAIKSNPQSAAQYMDDPRIMNAMMALMGLDMSAMPGAPGAGPSGGFGGEPAPEYKPTPKADPKPKAAPEPEPLSEEAKEELERKNKAVEQKDLGNQFYKKREFEKAIEHYDQAWELDNTNITILTNKAAVLFEQGKFQECIKTCEDAVDVGREYRADFKLIAKAFARIGNAYLKLEDLESAIKFYNKSLSEHRTPDVLNKLKEAEKVKVLKDKEAYFDTGLGDQAREKGNELFKASKFADAIKEYTEAIKRNEQDYKAYSNRAACYTKLMALFEAEKDCNACIAIDPTFVKAYIRKAAIEFAKKDYEKSIEILENAKEIDTEDKHTAEINDQIFKANQAMYQAPTSSGNAEQDRAEAMKRAQSDPEVMRIMSDPVMQQILQQMQTDPRAIQEHMKNPSIASNIRKLINVGIIRMG
jgi:stress-induced-phosphoprotein 1